MKEYKVIFHIDEMTKWKLLLTNVTNLLNGMHEEQLSVSVLANAEAVRYYDAAQNFAAGAKVMESLSQKDVRFLACNNALRAHCITKDAFYHFVEIVPAGVVELVKRQSEGYAYIKP